jgi:hypothetical protein
MENTFNGLPTDRLKRAFSWIVMFRNFPAGCQQTFNGNSEEPEAISLHTKGRYEYYYKDGCNSSSIIGTLTSEIFEFWKQGTFNVTYVEPTTRVCIYRWFNNGRLPDVQKVVLQQNQELMLPPKTKMLVCLGSVQIGDKVFSEETTFTIGDTARQCKALDSNVLMIDFTNAGSRH